MNQQKNQKIIDNLEYLNIVIKVKENKYLIPV